MSHLRAPPPPSFVDEEAVPEKASEATVRASHSTPAAVAAHYNSSFHFAAAKKRKTLSSFRLRDFNNWVKSTLITGSFAHFAGGSAEVRRPPGPGCSSVSVVDMCGGKGGDLAKVAESGATFTFLVDISVESVREARRRWLNDKQRGRRHVPHAAFVVADVGTIAFLEHEPIASWLTGAGSAGKLPARTVSCQMAMHYCFDTEVRARRFLANVSACLAPGGTFVGTMIDSARLVARIRSQGKPVLSNTLYRVDTRATPAILSGAGCPVFGAAYSFSLQDAVDDCMEYLVHWPTLVALAAEVDLEPVMLRNFHTYLADALVPPDDADHPLPEGQARALRELESRGVFGNQGGTSMSDEEWEVAGLYAAFAFTKRGATDASATTAPPDAFTVNAPLPAALANDVVDLFTTTTTTTTTTMPVPVTSSTAESASSKTSQSFATDTSSTGSGCADVANDEAALARCAKYCGSAPVVYCPCLGDGTTVHSTPSPSSPSAKRQPSSGTVSLGSQPTCGTTAPGDGDAGLAAATPKLPGLSGTDTLVIVGVCAAVLLCAGACCFFGCRGARRSGSRGGATTSLRKVQRSSSRSRSVGRLETATLYEVGSSVTSPASSAYTTGTYSPGLPGPTAKPTQRSRSTSTSKKATPTRPTGGPTTPQRPTLPPSIRVEAPPRPTLRPLTEGERQERDAEVERRAARLATRPSRQRLAGTTTTAGITYSDLPASPVVGGTHYTDLPPPSTHYGSLRLASRSTSRGRVSRHSSGSY